VEEDQKNQNNTNQVDQISSDLFQVVHARGHKEKSKKENVLTSKPIRLAHL